jgi:hypothetical protein
MSKLNTFDVVKKTLYDNDGNYYELSDLSNSFANTLYNTISKGVILSNGYSMTGLNLPTSSTDSSQLSGTKRVTSCNTGSNKITDALDNTCYVFPVMLETTNTYSNHCVIAIYRVGSGSETSDTIKIVYTLSYPGASSDTQKWTDWKTLYNNSVVSNTYYTSISANADLLSALTQRGTVGNLYSLLTVTANEIKYDIYIEDFVANEDYPAGGIDLSHTFTISDIPNQFKGVSSTTEFQPAFMTTESLSRDGSTTNIFTGGVAIGSIAVDESATSYNVVTKLYFSVLNSASFYQHLHMTITMPRK